MLTQAVVGGSIDIAQNGYTPVAGAAVQGADVVFIGGISNRLPYQLVVKTAITNAAQLKGQGIAISRFGSSTDTAADFALGALGLTRNDVKILQLGGAATRMAAAEDAFIQLLNEDIATLVRHLPDRGWQLCERIARTVLWLALSDQPADAAIQSLQHTGRRLLLDALDIDRADRARDIGPALRRVPGDHHLRQHCYRPVHRDIDRGTSGNALRGAAESDEVEGQDSIGRSLDRKVPLRIGGGTDSAPADADTHARNGMTFRRGDFAGHLDRRCWLLARCGSAQRHCEQHAHPHRAKEVEMAGPEPTLTLQHVVHGGALILRVVAWP